MEVMENTWGGDQNSPIRTVVGAVTTLGEQVKNKVTRVFESKQTRSYYDYDQERSDLLTMKSTQPGSPRMKTYGSVPRGNTTSGLLSTSPSSSTRRPSVPHILERQLTTDHPLIYDTYLRDLADTLPSLTVDKFSGPGPNYKTQNFEMKSPESSSSDYNPLTIDTDTIIKTGDTIEDFATNSGAISDPASLSPHESNASDEHEAEKDEFGRLRMVKIGGLVFCLLVATVFISITEENIRHLKQITASNSYPYTATLKDVLPFSPWYPMLTVSIIGAFTTPELENSTTERLSVGVHLVNKITNFDELISDIWTVPVFEPSEDTVDITLTHTFNWRNMSELFLITQDQKVTLLFNSTTKLSVPMIISTELVPQFKEEGVIYGGLLIVGLYVLIIFEMLDRTLSAILAAGIAIGLLAVFHERPTTAEMVSWLDMETLILLFSMMVMVSFLCETGFFNFCAWQMYKATKGAIWPMITALCLFTAVVSAFLDNVTTILLMTPVTIRICEAMKLNPTPVLISIVIFSNIGGAATPVGDPPNAIIGNDPDVIKAGIDFTSFVSHMSLGVIPIMLVSYVQLRITLRSLKSLQFEIPYEIAELKREIEIWKRAVASVPGITKDECEVKAILRAKIVALKRELKEKKRMGGQTEEGYKATLAQLEGTCQIKDFPLLIKCGVILSIVISMFFGQSLPYLKLSIAWTALLGAVFLLLLADRKNLDAVFARVEWSTLIFFSALFVVMESVNKLGLLDFIGHQTELIILRVNPESRTLVAIHLVLWVSGLASAFIDNIPFTTMMVKVVTRLSVTMDIPLHPLIWALAFGTCIGGNGTLIGASANVVCSGIAEQHGYRFTFLEYFKLGFPNMIVSLCIASVYLTICHYIGFM